MFTSQLFIALAVFVSIYLIFFLLIRLFADMAIVGVSLVCAGIAFFIPTYYSLFKDLIQSIGLISSVGLKLPEEPTTIGIVIIASFVVAIGVLLCLPFLPFSATYRTLLGMGHAELTEAQIKQLIHDELTQADDLDSKKIKQWVQEELHEFARAGQTTEPLNVIAPLPDQKV